MIFAIKMQARRRSEADFKLVRNPAFHRRYFALLNLGFEYWEPTGGRFRLTSAGLSTGYAKYLCCIWRSESALLDAAGQYLDRIAEAIRLYRVFANLRCLPGGVIVEARPL